MASLDSLGQACVEAIYRVKRERVRRIELPYAAWEAAVLPLNYTRECGADCAAIGAKVLERTEFCNALFNAEIRSREKSFRGS